MTSANWEEFSPALEELQTLNNHKLRQHKAVHGASQHVRKAAKELALLKFNIYALNGHVIFSTEQNQLGEDHSADEPFKRARRGEIVSSLEHRQIINSIDDMKLERDVVISYLPLKKPGSADVEAVYRVISDVTKIARANDKTSFIHRTSKVTVLNPSCTITYT